MELTPWTLLVVALLIGILAGLFLKDIITVGINIIILYLILIRVEAELRKRKLYDIYLISFLSSIIIMLLLGNFLHKILFWWITTTSLLTILVAEVYKKIIKTKD
ncbi:hypothetical protein B6U93_02450 [Candidatus Woesearchaeota archaeon ex4484_78]|nr:MAG: hypothetical protein B6U93_02450 [Candidatus Woesearchaeota archaeon ex4484_78]